MSHWDLHADVLAGLGLLGAAYLWGIRSRRGRRGRADGLASWRAAAFFGALATLFVALNGPIHDLSDRGLVTAHMVQHLLLTLVMPPLLLLGLPGGLLGPLLGVPALARLGRRLTRPPAALSIFAIVFVGWHLPICYEWALRHHGVHIAEHLLLMAAAVLFWWPVLGPLPEWPRPAPPAQLLYLFVAGIPMVPVAAFITLSDEILYPSSGEAARQWGLAPLADQRLGGVLMWVAAPLVFVIAMTIVFFRWMGRDAEPAVAAPARGGPHGAP